MIAQRTTNLNLSRRRSCSFCGVIPEIDIWRAAQLMLKRCGDQAALKESAARADELAVAGDQNGAVTRRRITDAVLQLANKTRPDRCTEFVVAPVAFAVSGFSVPPLFSIPSQVDRVRADWPSWSDARNSQGP